MVPLLRALDTPVLAFESNSGGVPKITGG